jgi:hypothetical protein
MARHMTAHKSADDRKVHKDELKRVRRKNHRAPIGLICRTFLPVSALCATILLNTGLSCIAAIPSAPGVSADTEDHRCYRLFSNGG